MRKTLIAVSVASVVLSMLAAPWADASVKAKFRKRAVSGVYLTPAVGTAGAGGGYCGTEDGVGCVYVAPKATETLAKIAITDASGRNVFASWGQDIDGDGLADEGGNFCGKTSSAISIRPDVELTVFVWNGPGAEFDGAGCPGPATRGTIKITLLRPA